LEGSGAFGRCIAHGLLWRERKRNVRELSMIKQKENRIIIWTEANSLHGTALYPTYIVSATVTITLVKEV